MDKLDAIFAFAALGHTTRLDVFRLLIKAGDKGLSAGEISSRLGVLQNTLSTNLNILLTAHLVRKVREGRTIRYYADFNGVRALLSYLMEDCCGGDTARCQPLIDEIACAC
jgi:DNA-binding transcriptional ArsR family regulator